MKYSKSFLITLGHNSSVIYFGGNGAQPIGYEEERLTKVKSDSSYPINALTRVLSHLSQDDINGSNVFISHWFDTFEVSKFPSKYFDQEHFNRFVSDYGLDVIALNSQFTHHDAHAWSTLAFAENFEANIEGDIHHIVLDGFGNNQEVVSIYKSNVDGSLEPIKKVYGYNNSLGLLYQYATSFVGMKENQDEYKFLGYEANIKNVLTDDQIESVGLRAYGFSQLFMKQCLNENTLKPLVDPDFDSNVGIDINYLMHTKDRVHSELTDFMRGFGPFNSIDNLRTAVGFYVQSVLEQCVLRIINKYQMKNVFLSGGCFMNVKLNKFVLDNVTGHVCVNPLTGDQGAAIGLFRKYTNTEFNFSDLCYGVRDDVDFDLNKQAELAVESIFITETQADFVEIVSSMLNSNHIVNVMHGNMEFGPRALCNTSTLAKPIMENTQYINKVNNRNEVMPMAPVMLPVGAMAHLNIEHVSRVIGSNKFMIMTHDYRTNGGSWSSNGDIKYFTDKHRGVLHTKPLDVGFTCRPQIISDDTDSAIREILNKTFDMLLINTSFNTHGRPILFSIDDAIEDFRKQKERDSEDRLILVILI